MSRHNVYVDGKVHVRARQCKTCIFGTKSPVSVERREGMVKDCGDHGVIPCHTHLYQGERIHPVCHGFYGLRGNMTLRLADAMDVIEWVSDEQAEIEEPSTETPERVERLQR